MGGARSERGGVRGASDAPGAASLSLSLGPSPSPSICSLSETSGGLWNFVFGGLCKKQKKFVESTFFFAASFLSL